MKPRSNSQGWGGDPNSLESLEVFRRAAEEYMKKATASKEAARAALAATGIYTKSGRLTKRFR